MKANALVFDKKPFSWVHDILTSQGFSKNGFGPSVTYKAAMRDSSTESIYWLEIPVGQSPEEPSKAKIGKPSLYGEKKRIPISVMKAAEGKLHDIADYIKNLTAQKAEPQVNHNSAMVQNEEEMKRLGKEMESMQTEPELSENDEIADPIQFEPKP